MNIQDITELEKEWLKLFPEGLFFVRNHALGDTKYIRLYLMNEWTNNIRDNDPLNQTIHLFGDVIDSHGSIIIKPQERHLAFSSFKTGWRNFKPVTDIKTKERLIKYFHKVYDTVLYLKEQDLLVHKVITK